MSQSIKTDENNLILNVMKARGRKEKERGRREVEMLKNLDSNFVIRLVDAFEGRSEVNLRLLVSYTSCSSRNQFWFWFLLIIEPLI